MTNLTIVQYAGDFREASERLHSGGEENYRAQRFTVEYVEKLAGRFSQVTTIAWRTDSRYDVILPSGARAIGAGGADRVDYKNLVAIVADTNPDLLVLRSPFRQLLHWSGKHDVRTMSLLADSFVARSLKERLSFFLLRHYLNKRHVEVVANHGIEASMTLAAIGVSPRKIVPWDFPSFNSPYDMAAKPTPSGARRICFVGAIVDGKGVFDIVDAVALLADRGIPITADIIGSGDTQRVRDYASQRGVLDSVRLVGLLPNKLIIPHMNKCDAVIVPTRHSYAEGMPLTIYEALCSRSPIIASDHPMFINTVRHNETGLIFPAGNIVELASQIERILSDAPLYERISEQSPMAWEGLQLPVRWDTLIEKWISGEGKQLLQTYSLSSYPYDTSNRLPPATERMSSAT